MAFRAFIAADVKLGPPALDIWSKLNDSGASLKMVNPEITHVTLRFLGDTDEGLTDDIGSLMNEAVAGVEPFDVELKGLGVFPKPTYIKVVWAGMEGAEPLVDISGKLEEGVRRLGFKKEKPFRPHLTLARVKGGRNIKEVASIVEDNPDAALGSFHVDRIVLKKSVLRPEGPEYSDIREAKLGP